jgi:hypothetical protein
MGACVETISCTKRQHQFAWSRRPGSITVVVSAASRASSTADLIWAEATGVR